VKRREFLHNAMAAASVLGLTACNLEPRKTVKRPNILFCIADDATWQHMGAYGCNWVKTPAFDRVAANGILFNNAYTPNAKCAPSRACILTGRNSWQLEDAVNHWCYFPEKFKSYPESLVENGYFTGYTAKGWAPGIPGEINGKKRQLTGKPFDERKTIPPAAGISDSDYAGNFEDFMEARPDDKPFCFWYGCREPHRGYEFRSGIEKGGKKLSDVDRVYPFWPDNETVRTDLLDYAYEVEYFDRHLGKMLNQLEEAGELDNTLVVVTADNGMPFPRIKGQEYEYSNHLPLAVMWADGIKNPGRTVDDFVSFIDFAPTMLELAGLNPDEAGLQPIQGRSLVSIFQSERSGVVEKERDYVLIGKERHDIGRPEDQGYPIRGIVSGEFLYVKNYEPKRWPAGNPETGYLNCDGSPTKTVCLDAKENPETEKYWEMAFDKRAPEEVYNIRTDKDCMNNLAEDPEYSVKKSALREKMEKELKKQGDLRMIGRGAEYEKYPYADESGRDFYNRYKNGEEMNTGWVNDSDFREKVK
jgi:N-sulfoglucosamine sulfohydrolase